MLLYDPRLSFDSRVSPEIDPWFVAIHVSLKSRQRISWTNQQGEVCEELMYHRIVGESNVSFSYLKNSVALSYAAYLKEEFHRWMPTWTLSVCERLSQEIVQYAQRFALAHGGGGIVITASIKIDEDVLEQHQQPQLLQNFPTNFDIDDDDDGDDDDDDDEEEEEEEELELEPRGLSCGEINKLKTEKFKNSGDQFVVCSVCMEEFSHGVKITLLPCSHTFHNSCIASWLKRTASCPLCRFDIRQTCPMVS